MSTRDRTRRALTAAFLLALAVRIATAWLSGAAQPNEIRYITIARGILSGDGFTGLDKRFPDIIQPPLHPLMLAAALLLPGPDLAIARAISILMGSLLVFPAALLARRLFGEKTARRAPFLIAVYPLLAHTSSAVLTESTFTLLVMTGILTLWRWLDGTDAARRPQGVLGAGLLFGASFLTRPEGLAFLAVAAVVLALDLRSRGASWRVLLRASGILTAGFFITILPYLFWIHGKTGRWLPAPKATLSWVHQGLALEGRRQGWEEPPGSAVFFERVKFGLNRDATGIRSHELFAAATDSPVAGILGSEDGDANPASIADPLAAAKLVAGNLAKLYLETSRNGYVIPPLLIVLGCVGLIGTPWTGSFRRPAWIATAFFAGSFSSMFTLVVPRYLFSSVVLATPWFAEGWRRAELWLRDSIAGRRIGVTRVWRRRLARAGTGLFVMGMTGIYLVPAVRITRGLWADHRTLGVWLGRTAGREHSVMSATPVVSYYAGTRFEVLPYANLEETLRYARHTGAEYLVADAHEIVTHRPHLEILLDPATRHEGLELVKTVREGSPGAIYLYRIEREGEP